MARRRQCVDDPCADRPCAMAGLPSPAFDERNEWQTKETQTLNPESRCHAIEFLPGQWMLILRNIGVRAKSFAHACISSRESDRLGEYDASSFPENTEHLGSNSLDFQVMNYFFSGDDVQGILGEAGLLNPYDRWRHFGARL